LKTSGTTFESWKDNWKKTAKVLAKDKGISHDKVLDGEGLFIGYIINSYNQYSQKPIKRNEEWIETIPGFVRRFLSEKHCRNGLVEKSCRKPLALVKDFGQLSPLSQQLNKAIFNLDPIIDGFDVKGTKDILEQSKVQFADLANEIVEILNKY
jgi:hypothetical protein